MKVMLADCIFSIETRFAYSRKRFWDYRIDDASEIMKKNIDRNIKMLPVTISVSEEEILAENKDGGNWPVSYLEFLAIYRKICKALLREDILLFHCSALSIDGNAYLFTGPSGTGKSTHARLWRERFGEKIVIINDDKPLLRFSDRGIRVYGTPYGGKDNLQTNTSGFVKGIVILHQNPKNYIRRIKAREAYPMLLNQTNRMNSVVEMKKILNLVDKLSKVPIFELNCTISQEAVQMAYDALIS